MSLGNRGTSAFDRLRDRYDSQPYVCGECAYVDEDGSWKAVTSGATVAYQRECPSCGVEAVRHYRL